MVCAWHVVPATHASWTRRGVHRKALDESPNERVHEHAASFRIAVWFQEAGLAATQRGGELGMYASSRPGSAAPVQARLIFCR